MNLKGQQEEFMVFVVYIYTLQAGLRVCTDRVWEHVGEMCERAAVLDDAMCFWLLHPSS